MLLYTRYVQKYPIILRIGVIHRAGDFLLSSSHSHNDLFTSQQSWNSFFFSIAFRSFVVLLLTVSLSSIRCFLSGIFNLGSLLSVLNIFIIQKKKKNEELLDIAPFDFDHLWTAYAALSFVFHSYTRPQMPIISAQLFSSFPTLLTLGKFVYLFLMLSQFADN